jgi:drug/metabolite transporter (DMT)-like permease
MIPGMKTAFFEFIALAAIWGSSFLLMRLGAAEFGAWPSAFLRVAVAALCLSPWLFGRTQRALVRQHWRALAGVGLLNSALPFACYAYAVQHISTGLSSILNATTPLFGALVAWAWLGDRLNASRLMGLVLGFAGVAALVSNKLSTGAGLPADVLQGGQWLQGSVWAVLACLLATFCYALSASITKRYLSSLPPMLIAVGSLMSASVLLFVPALVYWPAAAVSASAWAAMLAAGVLCTGLAFVIYFRLIATLGPARTSTVTFLIPVFAISMGALLLGESVNSGLLLWAGVVLLGTALSSGLISFKRRQN